MLFDLYGDMCSFVNFPLKADLWRVWVYFSVCVVVGCTARGSVRTVVHPLYIWVYILVQMLEKSITVQMYVSSMYATSMWDDWIWICEVLFQNVLVLLIVKWWVVRCHNHQSHQDRIPSLDYLKYYSLSATTPDTNVMFSSAQSTSTSNNFIPGNEKSSSTYRRTRLAVPLVFESLDVW